MRAMVVAQVNGAMAAESTGEFLDMHILLLTTWRRDRVKRETQWSLEADSEKRVAAMIGFTV